MVNQGQKPISIWYQGLPPLYSWLPVDFVPSVSNGHFQAGFWLYATFLMNSRVETHLTWFLMFAMQAFISGVTSEFSYR